MQQEGRHQQNGGAHAPEQNALVTRDHCASFAAGVAGCGCCGGAVSARHLSNAAVIALTAALWYEGSSAVLPGIEMLWIGANSIATAGQVRLSMGGTVAVRTSAGRLPAVKEDLRSAASCVLCV